METYRKNSCAPQTYFYNSYNSDLRNNNLSIFPVFLKTFIKGLPKCKVAHSIRQSYLYKTSDNNDVNSDISKRYPLPYYYIRKQYVSSFYYKKNNLIAYYIQLTKNKELHAIPLYNYLKNDYEIVLSKFEYNFLYHHEVCLVRAPNRQVYICAGNIIGNVSKGTLLLDLSEVTSLRFLSMPIANTFFLVVMVDIKEIVICVIDLIKERRYVKKYPIEKIIDTLLNLLEGNDKDYKEIESVKNLDHLSFGYTVVSNIENNTDNLVFYNRCVVNITLYFSSTKTGDSKFLTDALSVVATFQNRKLIVSLQINDKLNIKTPSYNYEVNLDSSAVLMENSYKLDDKYDISQSHLYSVIAFFGDYTVISESNHARDKVTLYYKNEPNFRFSISYLNIDNFEDIIFIRLYDKLLAATSKDRFIGFNKTSKYYSRHNDSTLTIEFIDTKVIRELVTGITRRNDDKKLVAIDITGTNGILTRVSLKDKLEQFIRSYACSNDSPVYSLYAYYIDREEEKVYILTYFRCLERAGGGWYEYTKPKFGLFTCKIAELISERNSFRLVREFGVDTDKYPTNITGVVLNNRPFNGNYGKILRFLSKKWNTGNPFTDLKVFETYDELRAYYDFHYNRMSIRVSATTDTSIDCDLHLVRRIIPKF